MKTLIYHTNMVIRKRWNTAIPEDHYQYQLYANQKLHPSHLVLKVQHRLYYLLVFHHFLNTICGKKSENVSI